MNKNRFIGLSTQIPSALGKVAVAMMAALGCVTKPAFAIDYAGPFPYSGPQATGAPTVTAGGFSNIPTTTQNITRAYGSSSMCLYTNDRGSGFAYPLTHWKPGNLLGPTTATNFSALVGFMPARDWDNNFLPILNNPSNITWTVSIFDARPGMSEIIRGFTNPNPNPFDRRRAVYTFAPGSPGVSTVTYSPPVIGCPLQLFDCAYGSSLYRVNFDLSRATTRVFQNANGQTPPREIDFATDYNRANGYFFTVSSTGFLGRDGTPCVATANINAAPGYLSPPPTVPLSTPLLEQHCWDNGQNFPCPSFNVAHSSIYAVDLYPWGISGGSAEVWFSPVNELPVQPGPRFAGHRWDQTGGGYRSGGIGFYSAGQIRTFSGTFGYSLQTRTQVKQKQLREAIPPNCATGDC